MKYTDFQRELLFIRDDIEDIEFDLREQIANTIDPSSMGSVARTLLMEELSKNEDYQHLKDKLAQLFKAQITGFLLSDRITSLCEDRGVSIHSLEKAIGLSNGSVKRWEVQSPSIDKIVKVADYFSVTIDSLIDRATGDSEEKWLDSILNSYTVVKVKDHSAETKYLSVDEKRLLLYMATKLSFEEFKDI